ncbi:MAG: hypothetical protein ABI409_07870 [Ramlibacter sp.]
MPIDLTRSVLVVLIPGAVGAAPWLLWLVLHTEATLGYAEKYLTLANAVSFAVAVIAGLTFESLGTWLEVHWDKKRETEFDIKKNWFDYLASGSGEPVGYRYLSRLATMFYFELSMLSAVLAFGLGAALLIDGRFPESRTNLWILDGVITVLLLAYFLFNAQNTHKVLCRTRAELNKRMKPNPQ